MNTPPPSQPAMPQGTPADDSQIRAWLTLRHELAEMHARLEYLRLIMSLRAGPPQGRVLPGASRAEPGR